MDQATTSAINGRSDAGAVAVEVTGWLRGRGIETAQAAASEQSRPELIDPQAADTAAVHVTGSRLW